VTELLAQWGSVDRLAVVLAIGWLPKVAIGFSIIIVVHELGHLLAAKAMRVRVDRFAVGFFTRVFGYRRGQGFTLGPQPNLKPEELAERGWGETDYCLNVLPFGGYVRMLGEDDLLINEETGEIKKSDDPRAFPNKPVWRRMIVVSSGVVSNLLFAVLVYAFVYWIPGRPVNAPIAGYVQPGSPADQAGLQPRDRIVAINDTPIRDFDSIIETRAITGGTMRFRVARGDKELECTLVQPPVNGDIKRLFDIQPLTSTKFVRKPDAEPAAGQVLQPGDEIIAVNGVQAGGLEVLRLANSRRCEPLTLTVQRPAPDGRGAATTFTHVEKPSLLLIPRVRDGESENAATSMHVLGLMKRCVIDQVVSDSPALAAGLQAGDIVVQWGSIPNPVFAEILASIQANAGQSVPVRVLRNGEPLTLNIVPRPDLVSGKPRIGAGFGGEDSEPVVADVAPNTPAATLMIPRGARLLAIGNEPTESWVDVANALKAAAGTLTTVRYRTGDQEATGQMQAPSSIVNELNLPPGAVIRSIAGQESVLLDTGETVSLPAELAVRKILERNVGRTVEVVYSESIFDARLIARQFAVRADNTDPWQYRAVCTYPSLNEEGGLVFQPLRETLRIGNPLAAVGRGVGQTRDDLVNLYRVLRLLVKSFAGQKSSVSVKNVSGPIGILQAAKGKAEGNVSELLWFLAFISVNLAVLNFLPLPVVDGGLMVFLILELVRRRPLNVKVQMITTLAGLALIALVFLVVTYNDIAKWLSS
jgi:regulator of sigma E protease